MKTHDVTQGTAEWLAVRAGIPTASELDQLISPTGRLRTGDMPNAYLCRKLAERWTGYPLQSYSGGAMEQGSILEDRRFRGTKQLTEWTCSGQGSLRLTMDHSDLPQTL